MQALYVNQIINEDRAVTVVTLHPQLEELVASNIQKSIQGTFPTIDPDTTTRIFNNIRDTIESVYFYNNQPRLGITKYKMCI